MEMDTVTSHVSTLLSYIDCLCVGVLPMAMHEMAMHEMSRAVLQLHDNMDRFFNSK